MQLARCNNRAEIGGRRANSDPPMSRNSSCIRPAQAAARFADRLSGLSPRKWVSKQDVVIPILGWTDKVRGSAGKQSPARPSHNIPTMNRVVELHASLFGERA